MKSLVLLMLLCVGCAEEPDRLVGATTADGRFKLSLEAVDDWVRPGFSLPVKVRVESLLGPLTEPWQAELELVANNGDVSSSSIYVEFDGIAEDEIADMQTVAENLRTTADKRADGRRTAGGRPAAGWRGMA